MKISVLSGSAGNACYCRHGTRCWLMPGLSAREIARRCPFWARSKLAGWHFDPRMSTAITRRLALSDKRPRLVRLHFCETRDAYVSGTRNVSNDEPRDVPMRSETAIESFRSRLWHRPDRFHPFTVPTMRSTTLVYGDTMMGQGGQLMIWPRYSLTERLRACAAIVIESNHSRDMLNDSRTLSVGT